MLAHMVYFTLRDGSPAAIDKQVAACRTLLSGHPGTRFFAVGTVCHELTREVNDRDFHVALQMVFEDKASHDRYQVDARHQQFIAENRANWAKVRVFDAEVR